MFFIDAGQQLFTGREQRVTTTRQVWLEELRSVVLSRALWITAAMLLMLTVCVGAVIYSSHMTRQLYAELEVLTEKRDFYQSEWSQLLLEESALSAHGRVERMAKENMGMAMPESGAVVIVR
jgi:cell division protein FtsL